MPHDLNPRYGDPDNTLLYKIASLINAGGGGGGAGVASFNTRTGAVTLTLADVSAVSDSRYVLKSGDTMTGLLTINQAAANTSILNLAGGSITGSDANNFLNVSGTWNTSGAPAAIFANITNTVSDAAARLLKLQVGSVTRFDVSQYGNVVIQRQHVDGTPNRSLFIENSIVSGVGGGGRAVEFVGTWNTVGSCYGIYGDITDTNSGPSSRLVHLLADGATAFSVHLNGDIEYSGELIGNLPQDPTFNSITVTTLTPTTISVPGGFTLGNGYIEESGNATISLFTTGAVKFAGDGAPFRIDLNGNVGFFGAAVAAQGVSGADLTNNVTAGGTDDTIADFADLTIFANSAAAIRNDIYQLARKLKQVNDALRLYGLLT